MNPSRALGPDIEHLSEPKGPVKNSLGQRTGIYRGSQSVCFKKLELSLKRNEQSQWLTNELLSTTKTNLEPFSWSLLAFADLLPSPGLKEAAQVAERGRGMQASAAH